MSEGFDLGQFHVPQQSRRDKLRSLEGLHPALYDPIIADAVFHHHSSPAPASQLQALPPPVKQEGRLNLMGFYPAGDRADHHLPHFFLASSATAGSSSSYSSHHHLVDLPPSLSTNPSSSYSYPSQSFDQPRILYKPTFAVPHNSGMAAAANQGLSLSLSSQTFNPDAPAVDGYVLVGAADPARSLGPLGPFTGYSEVLKGSRFLKPAQQLLEEFCDVSQRAYYMESVSSPDADMDMVENSAGVGSSVGDHSEYSRRKTRLISMLNEVSRGYRHYYQQMQAVMASFESVHGLSKVAPFTPLAVKALSKHFGNLKNAIAAQLRSCKARVEDGSSKDDEPHFCLSDQHLDHQRSAHSSGGYEQSHVWRPQRGLPERAVAVLRAWLFEHFLHPYPTDSEKHMLAKQTGLSRNQVSNWFINARVRLWKPMVEEIHSLEVRQTQKTPDCSRDQAMNEHGNSSNTSPLPINNQLTYVENHQPANELAAIPNTAAAHTINFSYNNQQMEVAPVSHHAPVGGGGGASAGVSLTLGLHQGNGACLPEHYPLTVAHFGLGGMGGNSGSYGGFAGFSGPIRHFDGRLLHDFVG